MTTDELQQLKSLLSTHLTEDGPAAFFWSIDSIIDATSKDLTQAKARCEYAALFFRNRASTIQKGDKAKNGDGEGRLR